MHIHAVVLGGTGAIGASLVKQLHATPSVEHITLICRRPIDVTQQYHLPQDGKITIAVLPFNAFAQELERALTPLVTQKSTETSFHFFNTLGTTLKQAGSKAAFRHVDYDLSLQFAQSAQQCHAQAFYLVSATGANAHSSIFYNAVKGQLEEAVRALHLKQYYFFRPSLLKDRPNDGRPLEHLSDMLSAPFSPFIPKSIRPISVHQVAHSMVHYMQHPPATAHLVVSNAMMHSLA